MTDDPSDDATAARTDALRDDLEARGGGHDRTDRDERDAIAASGRLTRRDYLRVASSGMLATVLGGATAASAGTAAAQSDWEAAADDRIEEHRTADLDVTVVDEDGDPVADADVAVEMREHDFGFGVAVSAPFLLGYDEFTDADVEEYRSHVTELFNTAVLGNNHKWRFFEDNQDRADEATAWLLDQGMDLRGHTCIWGSYDAWSVPGDVVDAMGVDHQSGATGPDLDPEHVRQRSLEHVETIVEHYADFEYDGTYYGSAIDQWDVVNEVVHETELIEAVDGEDVDSVEAPILREWYERATQAAPDDVELDVNDYNTIEGPYEYARGPYERQIEYLTESDDVELDGAGLQSHFSQDEALSPDQIVSCIDRYAQHGVDVRITEFDTADESWADEDQAEFLRTFLKTTFSHEAVTDFVLWGIWDPAHWRDDAPLFYEDWSRKPAYDEYVDLVFDEWWTEESGRTDAGGTFGTTAFLGEYEITVSTAEDTVTETVSVTEADAETVEIEVEAGDGEGDDCSDAADAETLSDGSTVCDVDGDGNYRDVNGDGDVSNGDVVDFFGNQHVDPWDSRTDLFDFDGDGEVGQSDVVALFEHVGT